MQKYTAGLIPVYMFGPVQARRQLLLQKSDMNHPPRELITRTGRAMHQQRFHKHGNATRNSTDRGCFLSGICGFRVYSSIEQISSSEYSCSIIENPFCASSFMQVSALFIIHSCPQLLPAPACPYARHTIPKHLYSTGSNFPFQLRVFSSASAETENQTLSPQK